MGELDPLRRHDDVGVREVRRDPGRLLLLADDRVQRRLAQRLGHQRAVPEPDAVIPSAGDELLLRAVQVRPDDGGEADRHDVVEATPMGPQAGDRMDALAHVLRAVRELEYIDAWARV